MCGIGAILDPAGTSGQHAAERMVEALRHRGPDGEALRRIGPVALAHTRLAIIDVAGGDQPLDSEDGRVTAIVNGEIYNHAELRAVLEQRGHRWATNSDSEVVVHAYEEHGVDCVRHLNGIFAFVVWDQRAQRLVAARDGFGVKPLYWWSDGDALLFASELKSLLRHPALARRNVNRAGVAQVLVTRYVSRPATLLDGVWRLPEGSCMELAVGGGPPAEPLRYWDVRFRAEPVGLDEAVEQLDALLKRTVAMQLMSDVPLGVQLSASARSSGVKCTTLAVGSTPVRSRLWSWPTYSRIASNSARRPSRSLSVRPMRARRATWS